MAIAIRLIKCISGLDILERTYTYTGSDGQKYKVPIERVYSISQLHKGDHSAIERLYGLYWHHAIVEDVEIEKGIIKFIEYSSYVEGFLQNISSLENPGKAKVIRKKRRLEDGLHLIKHKKYLPADTVLQRAIDRLGENEYCLFNNNCEHFALSCKTGISSSEQVKYIKETVIKNVREEIDKSKLLLVAMKTGMSLMEGVTFAALSEVALANDINCAKADLKLAKISPNEYNGVICKRIVCAVVSASGSIAGEVLGKYLFPNSVGGRFVGCFIGGLMGRLYGTILWKVF